MKVPALMLALTAAPAMACEPGQTRHFACSFYGGTKTVEICHDADTATYAFGPTGGAPELTLARPVTDVGLVPWPGIGRTIWEEISFENEDHTYLIFAAIERAYSEGGDEEVTPVPTGTLAVMRGDDEIANLTCDPGSTDFPWSVELFDAKQAAGQCYDHITREWRGCETTGE